MDRPAKSNTDGIVLMIIGFGYGVLAAWALFYEWGSAPSIKQVDLSAWIQAIGSIAAILTAAAVPTALYLQQRRADRRKELANAKIAIAFALDGLVTSVWDLEFVALPADDPQEFLRGLKEIIEATEIPEDFKSALRNADSYPSLIDDMADYFMRAQGLNLRAQTTVRHVGTRNLSKNAGDTLLHDVAKLIDVGTRLRHRMQEMQQERIH